MMSASSSSCRRRGGGMIPGERGLMRVTALLVACVVLMSVGAEAKMSGKKLRTYLQKKMYQGREGDPTRPVMKLTSEDAVDVLTDTGRKFDCLIFITGTKEMNLPPETETYKKEFDFLANAAVVNLRKDNPEQLDQLIFAEMTYTNRTAAFVTGFGISSIPSAYFLKRDLKVDMQTGTMTPHRAQDRFEVPFTFMAEDFAKVLKNSHDIDVGPVVKPSFFDAWYALPLVGVSLIVLALVGWKVYTSTFIKNPLLWASASFSIFAIATSGVFFTLIKRSGWDVAGRLFYPARQQQTKGEGVVIAGVYLVMTMAILVFIAVIPRIKSPNWRHGISYVVLCIALIAGKFYHELLSVKGAFMRPRIVIRNS